MENHSGGSSGLLVGFLSGAIVGAAAALLFAPAPGKETRIKLEKKYEELRDKLEEMRKRREEEAEKV